MNRFLELICTWFYSGKSKLAPGTMGSLATLPFVFVIQHFFGTYGLAIFASLVSVLGIWAADKYAKSLNRKDPGCIVIDEVAGQTIALLTAGNVWYLYVIGFILFRLFDILKPWPVSFADQKIEGGTGIMLDDVFAGIMALGVLEILVFFFNI